MVPEDRREAGWGLLVCPLSAEVRHFLEKGNVSGHMLNRNPLAVPIMPIITYCNVLNNELTTELRKESLLTTVLDSISFARH